MKKVFILLSGLLVLFTLLQCAGSQKPDPEVIACKSKCDNAFNTCIKKAVKNEAKKAACEAVNNKCARDCEKKK